MASNSKVKLLVAMKRPQKYLWGLFIATSNFAFEFEAILVLESTHLESWVAKIGLNGPND